jgi:hypothetical protein
MCISAAASEGLQRGRRNGHAPRRLHTAFVSPAWASLVRGGKSGFSTTCPVRPRSRSVVTFCAADDPLSDEDAPRAEQPIFAPDSAADAFWAEVTDNGALDRPLTQSEQDELLERFPGPIARFLIRRANQVLKSDEDVRRRRSERGTLGSIMNANEPPEPEEVGEDWYQDYVFETLDERSDPRAASRFRNRASNTVDTAGNSAEDERFADPLAEEETDVMMDSNGTAVKVRKTKVVSLFAGSPEDASEQAQLVGYAIAGLLLLILALKLIFAFLQFFVSFTFSFVAIFALSAGIFVFFVLLRF